MIASDIDRYIRSLQETLSTAAKNYEIWWVYRSAHTRQQYVDAMNSYLGFFSVSMHAHFVANVISLYRLFDTHRGTINLNALHDILPDPVKAKLPSDFPARMKRARCIWKKVNIIRNNCFGHLNGEKGVVEMFKQAKLTPNEMQEIMQLSKELLNDMSLAWNGSAHAFNLNARDDTIRLLDDLNGLNAS